MLNTLLCIILLPFAVCAGVFTLLLVAGFGKAITRKKK